MHSFFIFHKSTFSLEKNGKFLVHPIQVILKICISQRYVHNLERNWKNSVYIGVKNFTNLQVSKIHTRLH